MKALFAVIPEISTANLPFLFKQIDRNFFSTDYHHHKECQLLLAVSGHGNRIVGNAVNAYFEGDLTFIGSNTPHVWYCKNHEMKQQYLALFINADRLLEILKVHFEVHELQKMFEDAKSGFEILGEKREKIKQLLIEALACNGMKQFGIFIQIMELLINRDEIHYINSPTNHINLSNNLNWRASKILSYLQQNFKNDISLTEAADITGMQVHAFCRFFKNLTSLTYSDFIIELRISYTCQLLKDSNLSITQIAFDAGFNNISYFNRTFKKSKGISPRDYRKMLLELPNL